MLINISEIEFGTPAFDEALQLRKIVLRDPLGLEFSEQDIATEYDSWHIGAYNEEYCLLGCLIMKQQNNDEVKMRQVAIHPDAQKLGIGSLLVKKSEDWAKANNYKIIQLHARDKAIPFYEKLGYKKVGEEFTEVGIPHRSMEKTL